MISDELRAGLARVSTRLRTMAHHQVGEPVSGVEFNMNHWKTDLDCGTVVCIGGLLQLELPGFRARGPLEGLFIPDLRDYSAITPEWAADTIDHFLLTGEINWNATTPQ